MEQITSVNLTEEMKEAEKRIKLQDDKVKEQEEQIQKLQNAVVTRAVENDRLVKYETHMNWLIEKKVVDKDGMPVTNATPGEARPEEQLQIISTTNGSNGSKMHLSQ